MANEKAGDTLYFTLENMEYIYTYINKAKNTLASNVLSVNELNDINETLKTQLDNFARNYATNVTKENLNVKIRGFDGTAIIIGEDESNEAAIRRTLETLLAADEELTDIYISSINELDKTAWVRVDVKKSSIEVSKMINLNLFEGISEEDVSKEMQKKLNTLISSFELPTKNAEFYSTGSVKVGETSYEFSNAAHTLAGEKKYLPANYVEDVNYFIEEAKVLIEKKDPTATFKELSTVYNNLDIYIINVEDYLTNETINELENYENILLRVPVVGEKGALTSSLLSENWSSVVNTILDEKIELTVEALDLEEDSITFIYILTKNKNENNKVTNKIRVDVLTSAENEARVAKFYAAVQNKSAINDDYYTFTGVDVGEDKITILNDKVNDKIKANSEVNPNNTTLTFAELVKIIQAVNESNESNEKTPDETVE